MRFKKAYLFLPALLLTSALALVLAAPASAQGLQARYDRAKADYKWLSGHEQAREVYHNWQSLAERFSSIYTAQPEGPLAAGCLLWMGRIHLRAYERFNRITDFHQAVDDLRRLVNHFPRSNLADDAQMMIGHLYEQRADPKQAYLEYLRVTINHPQGDMVEPAKKKLDELEQRLASGQPAEQRQRLTEDEPASTAVEATPAVAKAEAEGEYDPTLAKVTELRHWSTPSYTRVVLNLDRPVPYSAHLLKKDPRAHKPRRLYLDLSGARLPKGFQQVQPIKGNLLMQARAGQFNRDTVRLVLDIQDLKSYKVFGLQNPFRVVIDCFGQKKREPTLRADVKKGKAQKVKRGYAAQQPPTVGLAQALGLGIKRVVIDPGHGGKDPGCVYKGMYEKNITLDISRRLAQVLRSKLGCQVLLTRNSDKFLALEDRTAYANTKEADLFISVHVNAAPSRRLNGVETYFLNLASDEQSMLVAARENATSTRSIGDLQVILNDLMLNSKINESNRLARLMHGNLVKGLRRHYKVRDLKVRQAPFYVLIGAQMPAVLVEVGFITNPAERKRLATKSYRQRVADHIATGIVSYAKSLKKAGLSDQRVASR